MYPNVETIDVHQKNTGEFTTNMDGTQLCDKCTKVLVDKIRERVGMCVIFIHPIGKEKIMLCFFIPKYIQK